MTTGDLVKQAAKAPAAMVLALLNEMKHWCIEMYLNPIYLKINILIILNILYVTNELYTLNKTIISYESARVKSHKTVNHTPWKLCYQPFDPALHEWIR